MKMAIKASKNINTPPTMGKIIGAACATASIASGWGWVAAPSLAAEWGVWLLECGAFDMKILKTTCDYFTFFN